MTVWTKLHRSIWADPDFTSLPASAQRTYLSLISQPDISHCGVLAMTIRRWATLAADLTPAGIEADLVTLEQARFIVCDPVTEECWVRTYMQYDGLSRVHNGDKAIASAIDRVLSPALRHTITTLVTRGEVVSDNASSRRRPARRAAAEAPTEAPTEAASELAKPAASSQQNTASSQQPAADTARQAIAAWVRHRCDQPTVRNKTALARTLHAAASSEHGAAIADYLDQHPDADWQAVCRAVLGMSELDCYRAAAS